MTKEEYEQLLKTDYWKGYSYSLIKERNYICHDCGRSFPGERNKLQVHHLHYRDANPWSYNPGEVVVLCEECHRRRHGLETEESVESADQGSDRTYVRRDATYGRVEIEKGPIEKLQDYCERHWFQIVIFACIIALYFVFANKSDKTRPEEIINLQPVNAVSKPIEQEPERPSLKLTKTPKRNEPATQKPKAVEKKAAESVDEPAVIVEVPEEIPSEPVAKEDANSVMERAKTTLQLLEERNHAQAVESAKRAGVSTEGTTSEILDRITHANAVKSAERAGVSTEGTTSEILDRITHANAVKSAERAGVSTEGTTSEILDRITHANAVKSAKRAGVSTEGTTSEILDRITRKHLEEQ